MAITPDNSRSAQRHANVREQHSRELAQDYVESIFEIREAGEIPRIKDLQANFGVSHVTVIRTLDRLESQGLLKRSRDNGIELSKKGLQIAQNSAERHALVIQLLTHIGVSEEQANIDAEGLEHHLSKETISAIKRYLKLDK